MTARHAGAAIGASPLAPRRVAFQGARGAFGEDAIVALWPAVPASVPMRTVRGVVSAAARGRVDAGIVPVENVIAGRVEASCDALAHCRDAHVVGEVVLDIRLCLVAPPGATLAGLDSIESHPIALAQCARFLARHPHARPSGTWNTAGAARDVAAAGDPRRAAIAGRSAALRYGLVVLAEGVEDAPGNRTRFLAVARAPAPLPDGAPARTSVLVVTSGGADVLRRIRAALREHGLSASTLGARSPEARGAQRCLVEFTHAGGDPVRDAALAVLGDGASAVRLLGTYGRAREET